MVCGINWTLLKVAHSYRLSKSISAKSVRLVSVLHRCCCWNSSSFDWCGERWKLLKKTTKRGLAETGMKYFPGRHRTTAANSGTMQYHATVEGPQNWALVWGPGSRAPESKVLENSNTMQLWRSTSELSNSLGYLQLTLVVKKFDLNSTMQKEPHSFWILKQSHLRSNLLTIFKTTTI